MNIKPWYKKVEGETAYDKKYKVGEIRIYSGSALLPVIKAKIEDGKILDVCFVGFKSIRKSKDIAFILNNHELFLQWLDLINVVEFFEEERFLVAWLEQEHFLRIEERNIAYTFEKRDKG